MRSILVLSLLLLSCGPQGECYNNGFSNIIRYEITPDITLTSGIRVDSGGFQIDTGKLQERLTNIDDCIIDVVTNEPEYMDFFPPGEIKLKKDCIVIKVVDAVAGCSEWQFIDVLAPESLCRAKGVKPTSECPCRWRTALLDDNVVLTPSDVYLWEVVRMHTGLDYIWDTPFAKCAVL